MTATNMCSNFFGFRSSPPLKKKIHHHITAKRFSNPHILGSDAQGALELGLPQIR